MSRLKQLRENCSLSQSDLAFLSQTDVRQIQNWEQGRRSIDGAKIKTLASLALALSCNLSDIIYDEDTAELIRQIESRRY